MYSNAFLMGVLLSAAGVIYAQNANFSCDGRPQGYYADVNTGCQIYHMCDGLGRQFSYSCPNATLFQQRMLICDHWYMVNCSKSEPDYIANLLIGQRNKPFVEDSEKHPYHRTPRPNLAINSTTEYNIIYRRMRSRTFPNLVGIEFDEENRESNSSRKQLFYTPPTHWFTQYSKDSSAKPAELPTSLLKKQKNPKTPFENNKTPIKTNKFKYKPGQVTNQKSHFQKTPVRKNNFLNKFTTSKEANNYESTTDFTRAAEGKNQQANNWESLRKLFLIPDYDFPLEAGIRRGYDNGPTSFQVKTIPI